MVHSLVVHWKRSKFDVYVGRGKGSIWGNPFTHLESGTLAQRKVGSRTEAVARFESWVRGETDQDLLPEQRKQILRHLAALKGKTLGCWCAPQPCHADVLARMANE